jgi:catechol-2,3-dioxygenase
MLNITGVYEVAIRVKDLARAEEFYREILGLDVGVRDDKRKWLFLRAGTDGMIVLQEDQGEWPTQHFAFTVDESHIAAAATELRERGLTVEGPVYHEWVPASSLYFSDPDGHELELLAPSKKEAT